MAWKGKKMKEKMSKREQTRQMTILAMFIAIIAILGLVPSPLGTTLGFYRVLGDIEATIIHIPVLIGAALFGKKFGIYLALAFGVVSNIAAFLYHPYFFIYPWVAILPRLAFGFAIVYVVNFFLKVIKNKYFSLVVSFFLLTIIHAILTLGMLFTVFPMVLELPFSGETFKYYLIIWLPLMAGFPWVTLIEAVVAGIIGAAVVIRLAKVIGNSKFIQSSKGSEFVDENNGYICGGDGAFIKTEDGGSSWIDISLNNTMQLRNIFFIDENNGWMIDYFGKSILHTTDGGYNWSSSQLGGSIIYQPESIFFLNETDGYVNTDDGLLYKTYDGGSTWEVIYGFYSGWNSSIYFTTETEGWYITGMVFHTYDGGESWSDGERFGTNPRSLFFLDKDQGWIGGSSGLIAKYDGTVEISELDQSLPDVVLFPNPAGDQLQIKFSQKPEDKYQLSIYSIDGKVVFNSLRMYSSEQPSMNISMLPPGSYFLQIKSNKGINTLKFVKR